MNKNLYENMHNLLKIKGSDKADIKYLGIISVPTDTKTGKAMITKDLFVLIDTFPDGSPLIRYYDESGKLLAGRGDDGMLFVSSGLSNEDIGFLDEIDNIDETQEISLNELDKELDKVSKALGISKDKILSMSKVELDTAIDQSDKKQLDLSDDKVLSQNEIDEQNKDVLENLEVKQEIDLDKKIDDRYTLADVFDVQAGSELIVVDSDEIEDNENTTRFSCAIRTPDGKIQSADMLTQVRWKKF